MWLECRQEFPCFVNYKYSQTVLLRFLEACAHLTSAAIAWNIEGSLAAAAVAAAAACCRHRPYPPYFEFKRLKYHRHGVFPPTSSLRIISFDGFSQTANLNLLHIKCENLGLQRLNVVLNSRKWKLVSCNIWLCFSTPENWKTNYSQVCCSQGAGFYHSCCYCCCYCSWF